MVRMTPMCMEKQGSRPICGEKNEADSAEGSKRRKGPYGFSHLKATY